MQQFQTYPVLEAGGANVFLVEKTDQLIPSANTQYAKNTTAYHQQHISCVIGSPLVFFGSTGCELQVCPHHSHHESTLLILSSNEK